MHPSKADAMARHRAGDLDGAEALYRALLDSCPDDPDLLGLAGIVRLQRGDPDAAERRLRRAVAAGGEAVIALRNLNSLVVLLLNNGRRDEAAELIDAGVPVPGPEAHPPDRSELPAIRSLAEAMLLLDRAAAATALLDSLRGAAAADAGTLELLGHARLAAGDPAAAVGAFDQAIGLDPASAELRIARAAAQEAAGQRLEARQSAQEVAEAFPVYVSPAVPGQRATVLVISLPPRVLTNPRHSLRQAHFRDNYIAQLAQRRDDRYRFVSVFPSADMRRLVDALPKIDLCVGNLAVPERALDAPVSAELARFAEAVGVPVLNDPALAGDLSRDRVAALLTGCPGLRIPRIRRIQGDTARAAAFGQFPEDVPFPLILRSPWAHSSSSSAIAGADLNVFLARNPLEAAAWIGHSGLTDLYLIEYVDLARPDGTFRRLRAMVAGGEILLHSASYYDHWLVGGWRIGTHAERFYDAHPECIQEGARIIADPAAALGAKVMEALARLRDRISLDLFGIDFDVDPAGRIVVFEVSAGMIFLPAGPIPERLLPLALLPDQIDAAFARLVEERIGAPAANA